MRSVASIIASLILLGQVACTQVLDEPINVQASQVSKFSPEHIPEGDDSGDLIVGLTFSGGGTRAAAYAYGILRELDATPSDETGRTSMTHAVRMVSGASGGAVTAAYFALKGPNRFADLRARFLDRDAEASMRTSVLWAPNVGDALAGGVNGRDTFARWLDENLFEGARYGAFDRPGTPIVWINASDIWNGTPFLFSHDTFAALCSDLDALPISEAVAASAALPVVFKPVAIRAYGGTCDYERPGWLRKALTDPKTSVRVRADARALESYQVAGRLKYVKLLDGGLTDNYGLTGFVLNRTASHTPYGPLSPRQVVRARTLLYLVADAGQRAEPEWGETGHGPALSDLIPAVAGTMVDAASRHEYDALQLALDTWRQDIVKFRCGLSLAEVRRHRGSVAGWDCRDFHLIFDNVTTGDLDDATQSAFGKIATRLVLPRDQVETSIETGRRALLRNNGFQEALARIGRKTGQHAGR